MKKTISIFLTLALCVGLIAALGVNASAEESFEDYFSSRTTYQPPLSYQTAKPVTITSGFAAILQNNDLSTCHSVTVAENVSLSFSKLTITGDDFQVNAGATVNTKNFWFGSGVKVIVYGTMNIPEFDEYWYGTFEVREDGKLKFPYSETNAANIADGKLIGNVEVVQEGNNKYYVATAPTSSGSTLSEGNILIVPIVAVVAIVGVAVLVIVKKKNKPAVAGGENKDEE